MGSRQRGRASRITAFVVGTARAVAELTDQNVLACSGLQCCSGTDRGTDRGSSRAVRLSGSFLTGAHCRSLIDRRATATFQKFQQQPSLINGCTTQATGGLHLQRSSPPLPRWHSIWEAAVGPSLSVQTVTTITVVEASWVLESIISIADSAVS